MTDRAIQATRGILTRRQILAAGAALPAISLGGRRALAATNVLVSLFDGNPPMSYRTDAGGFSGMIVDALAVMAAELGWQFSFGGFPWARAQEEVKSGAADALCTYASAERKTYLLFADEPLFFVDHALMHFKTDNPRAAEIRSIRTLDELRNFRISVIIGNTWPNRFFADWRNVHALIDYRAVLAALAADGTDIVLAPREVMVFYAAEARRIPLDSASAGFMPDGLLPFTFGLRKNIGGVEALVGAFNQAQKKLAASGAIDAALARYRTA